MGTAYSPIAVIIAPFWSALAGIIKLRGMPVLRFTSTFLHKQNIIRKENTKTQYKIDTYIICRAMFDVMTRFATAITSIIRWKRSLRTFASGVFGWIVILGRLSQHFLNFIIFSSLGQVVVVTLKNWGKGTLDWWPWFVEHANTYFDYLGVFVSRKRVIVLKKETFLCKNTHMTKLRHTFDLSFLFQDFFAAATGTRATITEVFLGIKIESDS